MSVLLVSRVKALREMLRGAILASGYGQAVEAVGLDGKHWQQVAYAPSVLFISSEAADGVPLVGQFRARHPSTVIGVLPFRDGEEEFIAWAGCGISGYVEPESTLESIAGTVVRLTRGEIVYPARLSGLLLSRFGRQPSRHDPWGCSPALTRRELDVVELLADGQSNRQIARRLSITEATVKNHVHSILDKLEVGSRGQAAATFRRSRMYRKPTECRPGPPAHEAKALAAINSNLDR